jgi:hypothetical protein
MENNKADDVSLGLLNELLDDLTTAIGLQSRTKKVFATYSSSGALMECSFSMSISGTIEQGSVWTIAATSTLFHTDIADLSVFSSP